MPNIYSITSIDKIANDLRSTETQLFEIAAQLQNEIVELTDKLNVTISERDRARRIAEKLARLLI